MDAHAMMLNAGDSARIERDRRITPGMTWDVAEMMLAEQAAYYHGEQNAYEHAAQMVRQENAEHKAEGDGR